MKVASPIQVRDAVVDQEFLYYDERDPCYTWLFPLRMGPFNPQAVWEETDLPDVSDRITLYVHVPYCTFICKMCPFTHEPLQKHDLDRYVNALLEEINFYGQHPQAQQKLATSVYFGGGTASSLSPQQVDDILTVLRKNFNVATDCQITLECHPRTVDRDYLQRVHDSGVQRVSFGIQSLQQRYIDSLRLHQKIDQSKEILTTALDVGFDAVAMDLMYRYADQQVEDLAAEIDEVFKLGVHGLSVYSLDPEVRNLKRTRERQPAIAVEEQMYYYLHDRLMDAGWQHIAQPDYSRPGHPNEYVNDIWGAPQAANLSFGAGSFTQSFNHCTWANYQDSNAYIEAIEAGEVPVIMGQRHTFDDAVARYPALGVRCMEVPLQPFDDTFGVEFRKVYEFELQRLEDFGLVTYDGDDHKLVVTRKGKFFIDNISKTFFNTANRGKPQPWSQLLTQLRPEDRYRREDVLAGNARPIEGSVREPLPVVAQMEGHACS